MYEHLTPYTRPDHYAGATFPEYSTVYGVHRESDSVARSNWRVLLRACGFTAERLATGEIRTNAPNYDPSLPAFDPHADPDTVNAPIVVTRASCSMVGWIDTLRISVDADPTVLAALDDMIGTLDDYPILDDDDHSDLEYSEACDYWARCSVRERVEYLQEARERTQSPMSIFAARRAELPEDPAGRLYERLTSC